MGFPKKVKSSFVFTQQILEMMHLGALFYDVVGGSFIAMEVLEHLDMPNSKIKTPVMLDITLSGIESHQSDRVRITVIGQRNENKIQRKGFVIIPVFKPRSLKMAENLGPCLCQGSQPYVSCVI